ncbi:MAG: HAMP domain-containing histidine kinase [Flammeovirgaceae bacterium]|nr:HAMP domain-containing histidine kinase [Flammeovirgaceae bacterium]
MDQRIKSLEKFIKDITEYSRNNRVAVHEEVVVVHDLVHEVWESLRYGPEADQITLECNFERTLSVRTDRERIKIILSNLISNALRYHDLEKTNRYVKVNAYSKDKSFILEIEDNGQGIEDEHKSRVFDMFFRANEKSIGSGLGLYIVKEALEKISGIIQVNSRIKEGSVFTIRLPFKVS